MFAHRISSEASVLDLTVSKILIAEAYKKRTTPGKKRNETEEEQTDTRRPYLLKSASPFGVQLAALGKG